ncbi:TRAP transporter small permease [Halomarina halobia]|uniref:TRAP transporter small permease n=1 Tax=Halomarina halobia TaxID=3033386 RepID=A0ABD6AFC2_9EURY|nr:TRAP transporter small permease subunit [Halomarina sp. PSR21]
MNVSKVVSKVDRAFDYVEQGTVLLGIALFVIINLIAAFQILMRFVDLGFSTVWTEELARYLLVIMVFVGAPYAMRNDDNISIRPLFRLLSARTQKVLITFSNIMIVVFSILVIHAVDRATNRTLGVTLATIDWLTVGHAQIVLGVMFGIVILFAIEETILVWLSDEAPITAGVSEPKGGNGNLAMPDGEGGD